jgi:hypothetical protein
VWNKGNVIHDGLWSFLYVVHYHLRPRLLPREIEEDIYFSSLLSSNLIYVLSAKEKKVSVFNAAKFQTGMLKNQTILSVASLVTVSIDFVLHKSQDFKHWKPAFVVD